MNYYYGVHGSVDSVFPKFIIKSIGIDFLIIRIDAYRLGLVFRPITTRNLGLGGVFFSDVF